MSDSNYMYAWEYEVEPSRTAEFLAAYGPNGHWVALFRGCPGYLRTELHRDRADPNRYITLDYWESADAWERFRATHAAEFESLDRRCDSYTVSEREIGRFSVPEGAV
jgi:heme-degrading monooxygenase HmoA